MKPWNSTLWPQLLTPGKNECPVGLNCDIDLSRFFLSSFSKTENMEQARLLLIEKLKETIAEPAVEEVAAAVDRRCSLQV